MTALRVGKNLGRPKLPSKNGPEFVTSFDGYIFVLFLFSCRAQTSLFLLEGSHELGLLVGSLEATVTELGGSIDELEEDLLGGTRE